MLTWTFITDVEIKRFFSFEIFLSILKNGKHMFVNLLLIFIYFSLLLIGIIYLSQIILFSM